MEFRILGVSLLLMAVATPAMAQTVRIAKSDCRRLVELRDVPDAAYKPGVDVRGKKVTPAGGPDAPDYKNLVPEVIEFPIALNPLKGGAARFGETSLAVGLVRFDMKSRRATLNGQELSPGDTQKLARKCRETLRETK